MKAGNATVIGAKLLFGIGLFLAAAPDGQKTEELMLQSRSAIRSGHLRLSAHVWSLSPHFDEEHTLEVMFDKDHLRGDVYTGTSIEEPAPVDRFRSTSCHRCFKDRYHVVYMTPDDHRKSAIVIGEESDVRERKLYYVPDPRCFGFLPFNLGMQSNFTSRSLIGSQNRTAVDAIEEQLEGHECVRLSWNQTDLGLQVRVWVVPQMGYNPVRMESEFKVGEVIFVDRVDVRVVGFSGDTIFFVDVHCAQFDDDMNRGNRVDLLHGTDSTRFRKAFTGRVAWTGRAIA